jgi:2-keto-4-pentenoate hydratase/2-oxohepta-3-ene-1,7-dioic acid hydratase in catechol pathway
MDGQPWLKEGDVVTCDFGALGKIENKVEKDPVGTVIG